MNVDPKAKAPPPAASLDFSVETATIQVAASETFEGVESVVNVKF